MDNRYPVLFEDIIEKIFQDAEYNTIRASFHSDHCYDIKAEKDNTTFAIEVKAFSSRNKSSVAVLSHASQKLCNYAKQYNFIPVLVVSSELSDKERATAQNGNEDLKIIDIANLLYVVDDRPERRNELVSILPYSVDDIKPEVCQILSIDSLCHADHLGSLIQEISSIPSGKENSTKYEEICTELLKSIFPDDLSLWLPQQKSNDELYRFDLLCRIKDGNQKTFWSILERFFNSKYVVFEFKNYTEKITQKEIYTTEKYLYAKALRSVAIIIAANGYDDNAMWAAKGCLRENGKLIILLNSDELVQMSTKKAENEDPSIFLLEKLDKLLIELEK